VGGLAQASITPQKRRIFFSEEKKQKTFFPCAQGKQLSPLPRPAPDKSAREADAIIDRLHGLYPKLIDLSLDRVLRLLHQLGDPHLHLPPVVHVAGTNGKGSTCAFLRAIGEAAGWDVHVTISPHLVALRERYRIAGTLVSDETLTATLAEIEQVNEGAPITVFEALVAAGYLLFSRTPAQLCVVEVGLGGRFDATNVIPAPAACAITSISLDHQDFLGSDLSQIAWEKAGIMKPGRPIATGLQVPEVAARLRDCAGETGALLLERGRHWEIEAADCGIRFQDTAGALSLKLPALAGAHQLDNAGIAIAALRASGLDVPAAAYDGISRASWPARLQKLEGRLRSLLPPEAELYLDGGHNAGAAQVLAGQLARWNDRPVHLVAGMKQGKDAAGFLAPLLPFAASVWAVQEPGQHLALPLLSVIEASGGVARPGPDVAGALRQIAAAAQPVGRVLICGSLYLAGEVLKADRGHSQAE
jgi:dihydrofolate synthase/folylpolyglutamate synthase